MGRKYYYLPRHVQTQDLILGEDVISKFSLALPIEMYMTDTQGFEGDKEMFSKFGLQISNSYKLVVSADRWVKEVGSQFDGNGANGEAAFDVITNKRPQEGDLIYDPLTKFLMEIKFCDHDTEFFQLGKNYLFYLSCEAFQYQQEEISTGVLDIDAFGTGSTDLLLNQLMTEASEAILVEPFCDDYLTFDTVSPTNIPQQSRTEFDTLATSIGYTVQNPFS